MGRKTVVAGVLAVVVLIVIIFYSYSQINSYREESKVYKILLVADLETTQLAEYSSNADYYYSQALESYDYDLYDDMVKNCELSRDNSFKYVNGIRETRAKLNGEDILIKKYNLMLGEVIVVYENLYESCEHLESAGRRYKAGAYADGDLSLNKSNEKVQAHDDAVRRYNSLIAEYKLELEKKILN